MAASDDGLSCGQVLGCTSAQQHIGIALALTLGHIASSRLVLQRLVAVLNMTPLVYNLFLRSDYRVFPYCTLIGGI